MRWYCTIFGFENKTHFYYEICWIRSSHQVSLKTFVLQNGNRKCSFASKILEATRHRQCHFVFKATLSKCFTMGTLYNALKAEHFKGHKGTSITDIMWCTTTRVGQGKNVKASRHCLLVLPALEPSVMNVYLYKCIIT